MRLSITQKKGRISHHLNMVDQLGLNLYRKNNEKKMKSTIRKQAMTTAKKIKITVKPTMTRMGNEFKTESKRSMTKKKLGRTKHMGRKNMARTTLVSTELFIN